MKHDGRSESGEELGYPAGTCPFCHERGTWVLTRIGDVVVSWSCDGHLSWVLDSLQRKRTPQEITEVVVQRAAA